MLGYDYRRAWTDADDGPGVSGAQMTLVDLAGAPKVIGRFTIEGGLLDARQVGGTARVVRALPARGCEFPDTSKLGNDDARIAANRSAIDAAPVEAWLPQWTVGRRRRQAHRGPRRLRRGEPPEHLLRPPRC